MITFSHFFCSQDTDFFSQDIELLENARR